MLDQARAPLFEALRDYAVRDMAAFHTPGHNQGRGMDPEFRQFLGAAVLGLDLTELDEVDNLHEPEGVIRDAQALAADAFGAEASHWLVNGASVGLQAAIMAVCRTGEGLLVPPDAHPAVAAGLTLAGAHPVVLPTATPLAPGIPGPVTADMVASGLAAHPEVRVLLVTNPGRFGVVSELAAIAALCRNHGIPLLVDEARGAHFHFHPALPPSGCAVGADIVVQSGHKTLSGLAQTGWLHLNGRRVDRPRVRKLLQLLQSSSPSYVLMASLDAARRQMARSGAAQLAGGLALAADLRRRIDALPGLAVVALPGLDLTQVVIDVSRLGVSGPDAARRLREGHQVRVADASARHLVLSVTGGNTEAEGDRLVAALTQLSAP